MTKKRAYLLTFVVDDTGAIYHSECKMFDGEKIGNLRQSDIMKLVDKVLDHYKSVQALNTTQDHIDQTV